MLRAFIVLGVVLDVLIALFLVLVFGWIVDSWHDPKGVWVGLAVTSTWVFAFGLSVTAPLVGLRLSRRRLSPVYPALIVWLPTLLLGAVTIVGFALSPP
jgi:hypothetical protein